MSLHDRCWNLGFEITTARTTLDRSLVFTVGGQVTSWLSMIWTDLATQNGSQIPIILVHTLVQFLSSCAPGTPSLTLFNPVHTNVDLPAWLQLHTCTYSVLGKAQERGKMDEQRGHVDWQRRITHYSIATIQVALLEWLPNNSTISFTHLSYEV